MSYARSLGYTTANLLGGSGSGSGLSFNPSTSMSSGGSSATSSGAMVQGTSMTSYGTGTNRPPLPSCMSQADHDKAAYDCRNDIRGLGALGATAYTQGPYAGYDPCEVAKVPVCWPGTKPVTVTQYVPSKAVTTKTPPHLPAAPPSAAQAQPPHLPAAPPTYVKVPPPPEQAAVASGWSATTVGLLALLAVGGGYVVYRTVKKKPARMAQNRSRRRIRSRRASRVR